MKRPQVHLLWYLAEILAALALLDIICTSVGLFYFEGKEGNPLLVMLAEHMPLHTENERIVLGVWLSKASVIALILIALHQVVKSDPVRDDWVMFIGLLIGIAVYLGVIGSWFYYFFLFSQA